MEKLKMESIDMKQKNIEKIEALFPNVITEMRDEDGNLKKGINFELLKQELSGDIVEGEEHYEFTWVGKKAAIVEGNKPIRKTLRPCIEESKDWENTGNLYIEGDNLDVLKLLQESYLNSIKMIYIDPPYNTGKDSFIYNDKFVMTTEDYENKIEYRDDEGNIQFRQNNYTNPRFHSDWCSMLYPTLKLVHNLLTKDGVIFISIDDREVANLRKLADQIFGEDNFIANVIWQKKYTRANDAKWFSDNHDHILCYGKDKQNMTLNMLPRNDSQLAAYSNPDNHPKGVWKATPLHAKSGTNTAPYTFNNGVTWSPPIGTYRRFNDDAMKKMDDNNEIWFGLDGSQTPARKSFLCDVKEGVTPVTLWLYDEVGHNHEANNELKELNLGGVFNNPKPTRLLKRALVLATKSDDIILDFFSGSATTAHAVMQLNVEAGGNRKFIMVQLQEPCNEESEAYKAGYKNICEIGKERIRRAGEKIKDDNKDKKNINNLDTGFRVLKLDSTNMKDIYYAANEYSQDMLSRLESNIKKDRTDLDLLYGVLLDWGLSLSLGHKIEEIGGITVHTVDEGALIACFAEKVSESIVREIAKRQPLRVVFRDSSFANSPDKINVEEIFKLLAPNTTVKVI